MLAEIEILKHKINCNFLEEILVTHLPQDKINCNFLEVLVTHLPQDVSAIGRNLASVLFFSKFEVQAVIQTGEFVLQSPSDLSIPKL